MSIEEDGKMVNKFYSLDLELENKCVILKLDPSSSHTEESPLFKFTKDDFANTQGEILVF
jgi:inward rectifier potassium channel